MEFDIKGAKKKNTINEDLVGTGRKWGCSLFMRGREEQESELLPRQRDEQEREQERGVKGPRREKGQGRKAYRPGSKKGRKLVPAVNWRTKRNLTENIGGRAVKDPLREIRDVEKKNLTPLRMGREET